MKAMDKNASSSNLFAYVYTGDGEHFELQKQAFELFCGRLSKNLLWFRVYVIKQAAVIVNAIAYMWGSILGYHSCSLF